MKPLGATDLKRLHREWNRRTQGRIALLLEGVQSPFNVGSIVRTAAAFRVEHLYLAGDATSPTNHKAGRTAMGTERYLKWSSFERGADAADAAREDGFSVVALELAESAIPFYQLSAGHDVCVVLGHEDRGITPATLAAADSVAFLPQLGRVGSLNVATAAAIALWELRRREWS